MSDENQMQMMSPKVVLVFAENEDAYAGNIKH